MTGTTIQTVGLTRDRYHKYQWNGGPKVPGVTTVIGTLDKSGPLVGWAKRETAACAVRNLEMLTEMVRTGGPDAAIGWLKNIPDYQRDASADLGSRIHAIAEALARKQDVTVTEEEAPFVTAYLRWMDTHKPVITAAEFMVYSETHGYGGTGDVAWEYDRASWVVDYKTGNSTQPSTGLQLVGLTRADWAGKPGDPKKYAVPKAQRFGVLHIRPEGAELIPYSVTDAEWSAFLACRQLLRWNVERADKVKIPMQIEVAA